MAARSVRVHGIVQGVGFRPYVYRLAQQHRLEGWVRNAGDMVEIHVEGPDGGLEAFLAELGPQAPPAARIATIEVEAGVASGSADFTIRDSLAGVETGARISPDLPVCRPCLAEMQDRSDRRYGYPYINCTDCGPRYSIVESVPYDRRATTMRGWAMCDACAAEYHDPGSRRFHAQPNACGTCGPQYRLEGASVPPVEPVAAAARMLAAGKIVAIKGIGGYHLACDARNAAAVRALRERKFRKEKPFAVMVPSLAIAGTIVDVTGERAEAALSSPERPIVLLPAVTHLDGVAPGNHDLGVMLPYTPLHHLLFGHGAPTILVMTSANRSSEPIAFRDDDARTRLAGIADALLVGDRPIARRIDDSVVRPMAGGIQVLRRSRGLAPAAVAAFPQGAPLLALGADLKNTVTLVAGGAAYASQHLGDLDQCDAFEAFRQAIGDLLAMHRLAPRDVHIVCDAHPQYRSTLHALGLGAARISRVQHHRAHVASVLAERGAWSARVVGLAADGTGFGDDAGIWGGELFVGSVSDGLERVGHLRAAPLVGGDAAVAVPVQAAVGFVSQVDNVPDLHASPFHFPRRFALAGRMLRQGVRVFQTTSLGRLFDAAAALCGFVQPISFEGQAAIWLEQQCAPGFAGPAYAMPWDGRELDWRPLLQAVIRDRAAGVPVSAIAAAFHAGVAHALSVAIASLAARHHADGVVASGGVMQNRTLTEGLMTSLARGGLTLWLNRVVPPNDGGVSLGQAALAAFGHSAAPDA